MPGMRYRTTGHQQSYAHTQTGHLIFLCNQAYSHTAKGGATSYHCSEAESESESDSGSESETESESLSASSAWSLTCCCNDKQVYDPTDAMMCVACSMLCVLQTQATRPRALEARQAVPVGTHCAGA